MSHQQSNRNRNRNSRGKGQLRFGSDIDLPALVTGGAGQLVPPPLPFSGPGKAVRGELVFTGRRCMRSFHMAWLCLLAVTAVCVVAAVASVGSGTPDGLFLLLLPGLGYLMLRAEASSWRYRLYQNRLDFERGILGKQKCSVWLWQVIDAKLERTVADWLTDTATVRILADKRTCGQGQDSTDFEIIGLGSGRFMDDLWEELQNAALVERRAIKWWGV